MKNFYRLLVLTICILMLSVPVFASDRMLITSTYNPNLIENVEEEDTILVQLNGEVIDFTDSNGEKVEPQIVNDRTMVPMRKIFEVLGADVEWFAEDRSIKATTEDLEINLQIENTVAKVINASGDEEEIILDAAPVIIDGRTLVPVRFIAESLDKKVGWDALERVVIIIDTSIIEQTIKLDAPNFYDYLNTEFKTLETYEMGVDITGKVKYIDDENAKNNTSLNMLGNMEIKQSKDAMALDFGVDITGKGLLLEKVKEQDKDSISMNMIIDVEDNKTYLKSSLSEEKKWIKYDISQIGESLKEIFEMAQKQNNSNIEALEDALINENELTIVSYEELKAKLKMLTMVMSNENFKVTGRNTKTYTLSLDLTQLLEIEGVNLEIELKVKIADKIAKESNIVITMDIEQKEESAEIKLELNGKLESYNEKVSIKMPKEKDVIEMYE